MRIRMCRTDATGLRKLCRLRALRLLVVNSVQWTHWTSISYVSDFDCMLVTSAFTITTIHSLYCGKLTHRFIRRRSEIRHHRIHDIVVNELLFFPILSVYSPFSPTKRGFQCFWGDDKAVAYRILFGIRCRRLRKCYERVHFMLAFNLKWF